MVEIYSILSILIGAGLLYFGLKWYGTSLAISFFVPCFLIANMFGFLGSMSLIIISGISILIFILSRPLTYFSAWWWISFILGLLLELGGLFSQGLALVVIIASVVIVWFIRTHLRAINIGITGGLCVSLGLSTFIFGNISSLAMLEEIIVGYGMLTLILMAGGIAFQYVYIMPRQNLPKEESNTTTESADEDTTTESADEDTTTESADEDTTTESADK